jgi:hypothetical protein
MEWEVKREMSRSERRAGVVVNYFSVTAIAFLVHVGAVYGWDARLRLAGIFAALGLGIATFIRVYWMTRLWQLVHSSFVKLDERQVQVVYESLRYSYMIFTILCLVVVYINSVVERGHVPILVAAGILYLAHTLPAAVLAWKEKEILIGG